MARRKDFMLYLRDEDAIKAHPVLVARIAAAVHAIGVADYKNTYEYPIGDAETATLYASWPSSLVSKMRFVFRGTQEQLVKVLPRWRTPFREITIEVESERTNFTKATERRALWTCVRRILRATAPKPPTAHVTFKKHGVGFLFQVVDGACNSLSAARSNCLLTRPS